MISQGFLGSLANCFIIVACNNNRPLQSRESKSVLKDSCRLERSTGSMAIAKVGECRHRHLMFDVPRMRADIPILNEIAALDSLKLSDYLFKSRHKGMEMSYRYNNRKMSDCFRFEQAILKSETPRIKCRDLIACGREKEEIN